MGPMTSHKKITCTVCGRLVDRNKGGALATHKPPISRSELADERGVCRGAGRVPSGLTPGMRAAVDQAHAHVRDAITDLEQHLEKARGIAVEVADYFDAEPEIDII